MTQDDPEPAETRAGCSFGAALVLAVGILVTGTAGLCTLAVIPNVLKSSGSGTLVALGLVLIFGGIPIAAGIIVIVQGWKALRRR